MGVGAGAAGWGVCDPNPTVVLADDAWPPKPLNVGPEAAAAGAGAGVLLELKPPNEGAGGAAGVSADSPEITHIVS